MWDSTLLSVTAGVLKHMTDDQLNALKQNVLDDGQWETEKPEMIFMDHETLFVRFPSILIGIEPDGYTHS
jgi:hypothetical protein